jgi:hypothetical protein
MNSVAVLDGQPSWISQILDQLFGSSASTKTAPSVISELLFALQPVFESRDEATLLAALDGVTPKVFEVLEKQPQQHGRTRDTHTRARLIQGLVGPDEAQMRTIVAMMLVCRDATAVLRELNAQPVQPTASQLLKQQTTLAEPERQQLTSLLRNVCASAAIFLSQIGAVKLAQWKRSTLLGMAEHSARFGAACIAQQLFRNGALAALTDIFRQHGVRWTNARQRTFALAVVGERLQGETTQRTTLNALLRLLEIDDDLPIEMSESGQLFDEIYLEAGDRMVLDAADAWISGRERPEKILRSVGFGVMDVMAHLDSRGLHRPVEALRLSDTERADILGRIRTDRLVRGGKARERTDLVIRDVVASQRIEQIDVRAMILPSGRTRP